MKTIKTLIILAISNCLIAQTAVCDSQLITIDVGWNMISSYIIPDNPNMVDVFSDVVSDIILVKGKDGRAYVPFFGINSTGDWEVEYGYQVKASNNTTLTMCGTQVDPTATPIPLSIGWCMISYLRDSPKNAADALSSISSCITLVKDVNGNPYIPSLGINSIGNMIPGQGYILKMICADTLVYPLN